MALALVRLAKHLAVLVCLAILAQSAGRLALGQVTIFSLVIVAATIHAIGRALALRGPIADPPHRHEP